MITPVRIVTLQSHLRLTYLKQTIGAKRMPETGAAGSAITVSELRRVDSVLDSSPCRIGVAGYLMNRLLCVLQIPSYGCHRSPFTSAWRPWRSGTARSVVSVRVARSNLIWWG